MKHCLDEAAQCERCGRMDDLKARNGLAVRFDCREELDREGWIAKHEECHYRKACRLKVKMPMRPFLVAAPRGIQARHARPDDGQSRGRKEKRAELTVIRGGRI